VSLTAERTRDEVLWDIIESDLPPLIAALEPIIASLEE